MEIAEQVDSRVQGQLPVNHTVHQLVLQPQRVETVCIVVAQLIVYCHSGRLGGGVQRIVVPVRKFSDHFSMRVSLLADLYIHNLIW